MTIDVIFTLVAIFLLIGLVSTVGVSAAPVGSCLPNAAACRQLATAGGGRADPRCRRWRARRHGGPAPEASAARAEVPEGHESPSPTAGAGRLRQPAGDVHLRRRHARHACRSGRCCRSRSSARGADGWSRCSRQPSATCCPASFLSRKTEQRKKQIQNGLPDALDLLIVCVEAGCGLDQAIVKAADELDITYPALTHELRLITTEIRAGKPRLEAFKNFAARTKVDDVRSLVALLVQTDKFGTSIAQALRTHAETSRTKRRQRAEERAAKVGRQAGLPARALPVPGVVRRDSRAGGHSIRSRVP